MDDTGRALMLGIASIVGGTIVVGLSKKIADAVVGDPDKLDEEKYELMQQRLAQRQFYIPPPGNSTTFEPAGSPEPRRQVSHHKKTARLAAPAATVGPMPYVNGAIENLEAALGSTNCGVCKKEIKESLAIIKEKTAVVSRADLKYKMLEHLKREGRIPQGSTWYTLKPQDKAFINRKVEERMIGS